MTARVHPFWWFVPVTAFKFDIRVFNMRLGGVSFIEGALVEIIQDSTVVKSGYTDANGKYATVLGAGTYKIRISKAEFTTIEKTESLAYPSELMVNLPLEISPVGRSGAILLFVIGEAANPIITTSYQLFAEATKKTAPILAAYEVSVA